MFSLNLITATILFGCGGSDNTATAPIQQPIGVIPTTNTVSATGVITGFGSVYVDEVRYLTDTADISINGSSRSNITALKVGMPVTIVSTDDDSETPQAKTIHYQSEIEGVVSSIDRGSKVILVAGTRVSYNNLTHFIDTTEASLNVGQRIEVNGFLDANNAYLATMVKLDDDASNDDTQYTRGLVEQLDSVNSTFRIGQLTVGFNAASIEGTLSNGVLVKVEGMLNGETITASSIEIDSFSRDSDSSSDDVSRYELEGMVTSFDTASRTLIVNGFSFMLTDSIVYDGGSETMLAAGVFVEIELSGSKDVVKIEFESDKYRYDGKVKGVIEQIDVTNQVITVNGVNYQIVATSRFEDDNDQYINLQNLQVNDFVELVFAQLNGANVIQRIEREDSNEFNNEWEIEGKVSDFNVSATTIVINGVTILPAATSVFLNNDALINKDAFFTLLMVGLSVEVEGYYDNNGELVVKKLEIDSSGDDSSDDSDDDTEHQDNSYIEIEGRVSQVLTANSFTLNNVEIRLDESAKLELNDRRVSLIEFMQAVSVGVTLEIEGVWVQNNYIQAFEAEIE